MMMMVMTMPAISICGASFKVLSGNKRAIFIFNLLASSRPAQYGSINNIKYQNILLATAHTQVTLISHRCYFHGKIWEPAESLVTLATTLLMWPWWVTERDKAWQRRCEPSKGLVSQKRARERDRLTMLLDSCSQLRARAREREFSSFTRLLASCSQLRAGGCHKLQLHLWEFSRHFDVITKERLDGLRSLACNRV